uniref:Uncharacterized protein n=1 Tax=Oryza glumipatula TaxID=40148 RepID=A0A0E0AVJ5_9ORYZ
MEEEMLEEQGESRRVVRLEQEVLIHIQVRRIKQEDEKARGLLQRLQLLEMRPTATAVIGFREPARPPSPSPLRRAGCIVLVFLFDPFLAGIASDKNAEVTSASKADEAKRED